MQTEQPPQQRIISSKWPIMREQETALKCIFEGQKR